MRKLAIFAAFFALAAAVFVYWISDVRVFWITGACLLLSAFGRGIKLHRLSIAALGMAAGFLWCLCYQQFVIKNAAALDGEQTTAEVQITQTPYETTYGAAAHCKWEGHQGILYGPEDLMKATPGDLVTASFNVSVTDKTNLLADGVALRLYAKGTIEIHEGEASFPQKVRLWLNGEISRLFEGDTEALVKALLLGDTKELSYEISNEMSVAGVRHAVAVSGMHVSILLAMVSILCARQPRLMAILGIPIVLLFVFVTGAAPSVCRAAVMQIILLTVPLVHRENDSLTALCAAGLILLLHSPWCIADVGFQLSFAATAGLITMSGPIGKRIRGLRKKHGPILEFLASGVSATLSATLATLPLTIFYFKMVSVAAILVNLLVLWAITGIFVLGLCACILGSISAPVVWVVTILSRYVLTVCDLVCAFPYAAAYFQNIPLMIWAVVSYFVVAVIFTFKRAPARWLLSAMTIGFLFCIAAARFRFLSPPWQFTVLDVGQGQCILLRIDDYTALVDCGGSYSEETGEKAARYLHSAGVTHIDALILTHYDADHAGGAEQFLSRVRTDMVFLPPVVEQSDLAQSIREATDYEYEVSSYLNIEIEDHGQIQIFPPVSQENANNSGITILATAGEYDMLITGDLDDEAELLLLGKWDLPQVDVLLAGHHGAKTSTSAELLLETKPNVVVISAGADNRYGHPHEETMARLEQAGVQIRRTDQEGDITFVP